MLSMQTVHIIRHKVLVEGLSVQQVAQDLGLSRTTVYKYLERPTPGRLEATSRRHPVLDAVAARIDALVAEWQVRTTEACTMHCLCDPITDDYGLVPYRSIWVEFYPYSITLIQYRWIALVRLHTIMYTIDCYHIDWSGEL